MSQDEEMGRWIERLTIADWLREHTHLYALAELIEQGVHSRSVQDQSTYCAKQKITRKGDKR